MTCYIEAAQDGDGARWLGCAAPEALTALLGPTSPADPARAAALAGERLRELEAVFQERRRAGQVDFSAPAGILLIRLLSLGRGAYYVFLPPEFSGARARLPMEVRLFYRLIDFPRHRRRGEILWRLGRPLGSIYPIISGMTQMGTREELSRAHVEWLLERDPAGAWRVRSARLLPETAVFSRPGS